MSSLALDPQRARLRRRRGAVLPALILVGWELSSHAGWVNPQFLPPLEAIAATGWRELLSGNLLRHLAASLARDLAGFGIGTSLGIAFGTLLGTSRTAERLVGPTFGAARQIAVLAWIPIISIWFGFAESAKVVFIALASFIPAAMNTIEGMRSTSPELIEVGCALRFTRLQLARRVFLPAAAPSIMTGVHLALIYSWLATVAAEYFMTVGPGIGSMIVGGRERFDMDVVMLGVGILGAVGFLMNLAAAHVEARALRWRSLR